MNIQPIDEFTRQVLDIAGEVDEPFEPSAAYDPDGDYLEFICAPDMRVAERIDDLVTVYRSTTSGEIIGSIVKDVSVFCRKLFDVFPGFKIQIQEGPVKMEHIFLARLWTSTEENVPVIRAYKRLIELAEMSGVEIESPCFS